MNDSPERRLMLPAEPALVAGVARAAWLSADGEIETLDLAEAKARIGNGVRPIVCHAKATAARLGRSAFPALDVLELYAFVRPARFALPTPRGMAEALGLRLPGTPEQEAESLLATAAALLAELADADDAAAHSVAWAMGRGGWPWAEAVLAALGGAAGDAGKTPRNPRAGLEIWRGLPEWAERPPGPPPSNHPVTADEAQARLKDLLGGGAEDRGEQARYAAACATAFRAPDEAGAPSIVLAEAGTGVGKTLGYIAPASLWAEKNGGPVWISTFTRNLQRQLDGELDRLHPDPAEKAERVVTRKGRENYFCILNFQEALGRASGRPDATALGLMARWALATRDGDMIGGDFPSWLADLLGPNLTTDLTDTRGECIYSACDHYGRCFIEHTQRRARFADIVVANHALVMINAALNGTQGGTMGGTMGGAPDGPDGGPARYVFDEGHHLFDAADGAFSAHLTGRETADLRRWLVGAEGGSRSRSRGLRARVGDLIGGDGKAEKALDAALQAAHALPGPGWPGRLADGRPAGPAENFLALVRQQVHARDNDPQSAYSVETETAPPVPGLIDAADTLDAALARLNKPLGDLISALSAIMDRDADSLDSKSRNRIEAACRGLDRRGRRQTIAWRQMLAALTDETPEAFVDWFGIERLGGRDFDVGMHRHWIDPGQPFAETVLIPSQGAVITSATLKDGTGDAEADWQVAERRTGARHLIRPAELADEPSPFDYAADTRVLVIGDVKRDAPAQVAAAYRELFLAAGGGGLGLFTAISRLRAVHAAIAAPLDEAGIPLLAQHVDVLDTGTLVDIFRAETDSCLLGTDAVRDGVDVPGRALRLIVFDRVPWPRPDILHRERRKAFGGRAYDEMLARLRLKQAYGRLIRRSGDRGVFVMLDRALPTRLLGAFPPGVTVGRLGLADAIGQVRDFLGRPDRD